MLSLCAPTAPPQTAVQADTANAANNFDAGLRRFRTLAVNVMGKLHQKKSGVYSGM
ncbi:hypothetical protein Z949_3219 [Sulfitobacter guttiformis KCTC 32187]|nr:hypothetical protein Z949_3219 [Sulfitobacter guttiformis KCTC 32187]